MVYIYSYIIYYILHYILHYILSLVKSGGGHPNVKYFRLTDNFRYKLTANYHW